MIDLNKLQGYTPGPWHIAVGPWKIQILSEGDWGSNLVAEVGAFTKDGELYEQQANARLISASPDLLEALREILREFNQHISESETCPKVLKAVKLARLAIAKAEHSHKISWEDVPLKVRKSIERLERKRIQQEEKGKPK
jgi:hypothetical protein